MFLNLRLKFPTRQCSNWNLSRSHKPGNLLSTHVFIRNNYIFENGNLFIAHWNFFVYCSLSPKNIVRFLKNWKIPNFDALYLRIEWSDGTQISHHCSLNQKLLRREIIGQSLYSFLRYGVSKLVIFQLSRNRTIFLGQREYI